MNRNRSLLTALAVLAMAVLATSAFASKYSDTIMGNTNVRAYWQFEEATGASGAAPSKLPGGMLPADSTFQYYSVGNGSGGTKTGVPAGITGNAVDILSGTTACGGLLGWKPGHDGTNLEVFNGWSPTDFSVSFWIKPITDNSPEMVVEAGGFTAFNADFRNQNGRAYVGFSNGGGVQQNIWPSQEIAANPFTAGQWNFVVFTFKQTPSDPTSGDMAYYVNGVDQVIGGSKHLTGLSRPAWNLFTFQNFDESYLDELVVFDVALSQQDILDQFNAVPEPGMLSLLAIGGALLVWRRNVVAKRA